MIIRSKKLYSLTISPVVFPGIANGIVRQDLGANNLCKARPVSGRYVLSRRRLVLRIE